MSVIPLRAAQLGCSLSATYVVTALRQFSGAVRLNKTLRVTPAMAANVTDRVWSEEELVDRTSE